LFMEIADVQVLPSAGRRTKGRDRRWLWLVRGRRYLIFHIINSVSLYLVLCRINEFFARFSQSYWRSLERGWSLERALLPIRVQPRARRRRRVDHLRWTGDNACHKRRAYIENTWLWTSARWRRKRLGETRNSSVRWRRIERTRTVRWLRWAEKQTSKWRSWLLAWSVSLTKRHKEIV
jgi:hypothetical protein